MYYLRKIDDVCVQALRFTEYVPLVSTGISASILVFNRCIEPFVFAILNLIPFNLTFYRQSKVFIYCHAKPYQELFALLVPIWGNFHVAYHREAYDVEAVRKRPRCFTMRPFCNRVNLRLDYKNKETFILLLSEKEIGLLYEYLDENAFKGKGYEDAMTDIVKIVPNFKYYIPKLLLHELGKTIHLDDKCLDVWKKTVFTPMLCLMESTSTFKLSYKVPKPIWKMIFLEVLCDKINECSPNNI